MAELTALGTDGLEARCGVHTGAVVVGEMGVGAKRLSDGIVGEAPNIAARLQTLAPPGSLVMSEATLRLVEGFFEVEPLGPQMLKGVNAPITIYRVLRPSAAPNLFEARRGTIPDPTRRPRDRTRLSHQAVGERDGRRRPSRAGARRSRHRQIPLAADASHAASRNTARRDCLLWFSTTSD